MQKNQNGADIPDKKLFLRNIGTTNSTTISFNGGAGWFKLATVTMPQASSVVYISLIGGAGYNVGSRSRRVYLNLFYVLAMETLKASLVHYGGGHHQDLLILHG